MSLIVTTRDSLRPSSLLPALHDPDTLRRDDYASEAHAPAAEDVQRIMRLSSWLSSTSRPSPGASERTNLPFTGLTGVLNTTSWTSRGPLYSAGWCEWVSEATKCRLAVWPIEGCVWCGTRSTP